MEGFVNNIAIAQRTGLGIDELPTLSDNDKVWRIIGYYLAHLCLNITYTCSPEVIIIGGGVLNRSILYKIIQNEFKKILNEYLVHPRIEGWFPLSRLKEIHKASKVFERCGIDSCLHYLSFVRNNRRNKNSSFNAKLLKIIKEFSPRLDMGRVLRGLKSHNNSSKKRSTKGCLQTQQAPPIGPSQVQKT